MITSKGKGIRIIESPVLLDLTRELKTGKWKLVELQVGRVNRMKVKKKG